MTLTIKTVQKNEIFDYIIGVHYIMIQITPHRGFSVTDYIKYYVYLCVHALFIFITIVILSS
jgi:hypothetical protein